MRIIYPEESPSSHFYYVEMKLEIEGHRLFHGRNSFDVSDDYDTIGSAMRVMWQKFNDTMILGYLSQALEASRGQINPLTIHHADRTVEYPKDTDNQS